MKERRAAKAGEICIFTQHMKMHFIIRVLTAARDTFLRAHSCRASYDSLHVISRLLSVSLSLFHSLCHYRSKSGVGGMFLCMAPGATVCP